MNCDFWNKKSIWCRKINGKRYLKSAKKNWNTIDQMLSYYPFNRRTLKWWKKLFFHLITMIINNSHVLYKEVTKKKKVKLETFMCNLALQLAEKAGNFSFIFFQKKNLNNIVFNSFSPLIFKNVYRKLFTSIVMILA